MIYQRTDDSNLIGGSIDIDRAPPMIAEATEAEQSLIAAVLFEPRHLDFTSDLVVGSDFYDPALGRLFDALVNLRQTGKPIRDTVLLVRELEAMSLLAPISLDGSSGRAALIKLASRLVPPSSAPYYAKQIRDYSRLRQVAYSATTMWAGCYVPGAQPQEIAETGMAQVQSILANENTSVEDLTQACDLRCQNIQERSQSGRSVAISTGLPSLDELAGGFFPGEVTILAARPSNGKSALALQLAVNAASGGHPVLFVSLEMNSESIADRMIARETGIPPRRLQNGALTSPELALVKAAQEELNLQSLPIRTITEANVTPARIAARAHVLAAQIGLKLVVVDYLGLVTANERYKSVYERVSALSREIKLVAQGLNIPILLLAQLNREGAKGIPTLEHLRDSGSIEQDANNVWFLHREDPTAREFSLIVEKQRQGEKGKIDLELDGPRFTFMEALGTAWPG